MLACETIVFPIFCEITLLEKYDPPKANTLISNNSIIYWEIILNFETPIESNIPVSWILPWIQNAKTNESIIAPAIIAPIKIIFIILSKESKDLDKAKNVSSLFTIVYLFHSAEISLNFAVTLSTSVLVLNVALVYFTSPSEYPYKVLTVSTSVIKRFSGISNLWPTLSVLLLSKIPTISRS